VTRKRSKPTTPTDPAAIREWVASLSSKDVSLLAQQVVSGRLLDAVGVPDASGRASTTITLPPPPAEPSLLTFTIELRGSKPRIWRRLAVPGDLTLDAVHELLQAAMGWSDTHLHRFEVGGKRGFATQYFLTDFDLDEGDEGTPEGDVRLDQVLRAPGDRLTYLYDFGDGWDHRIVLESVAPLTPDNRLPTCLKGAKACPPEDVGGLYGHHEIAAWLRAGAPPDAVPEIFEDAAAAFDWLPLDYDPDVFDPAEATAAMRHWL